MATAVVPGKAKKPVSPIAERFRIYRLAAGLTQVALAALMGKSSTEISGFETGQRNRNLAFLRLAADAMNCDISDFLDTPDKLKSIVLIPCPEPTVMVGRTIYDARSLEALGYAPAVSLSHIEDLVNDSRDHCGVSIRHDLAPFGPIPYPGDSLGINYRRQIYEWADRYIGDKIPPRQRELFRRVYVEGEPIEVVAEDLTFKTRTGTNSSARQCVWFCRDIYDPLIAGPVGMKMAGYIIASIAGVAPKNGKILPTEKFRESKKF